MKPGYYWARFVGSNAADWEIVEVTISAWDGRLEVLVIGSDLPSGLADIAEWGERIVEP